MGLEKKILVVAENEKLRNNIQDSVYKRFGNKTLIVDHAASELAFSSKYDARSIDLVILDLDLHGLDRRAVLSQFDSIGQQFILLLNSKFPYLNTDQSLLPFEDEEKKPSFRERYHLTRPLIALPKPYDLLVDRPFYGALSEHIFEALTTQEKLEQTRAIGIIGAGRVGPAFAFDCLKHLSAEYILLNNGIVGDDHQIQRAVQLKDSLESLVSTREFRRDSIFRQARVADYDQINLLCKDIVICVGNSTKEAQLIDRDGFLQLYFDDFAFNLAPHFTNTNANFYIVTNPVDLMALTFDIYTARQRHGKLERLKIEGIGTDIDRRRGLAHLDNIARTDKQMFDPDIEKKPSTDLVILGPHSEEFVIVRDAIKGSSLDYWARALGRQEINRASLREEIIRRGRGNFEETRTIFGDEASAALVNHILAKHDSSSVLYGTTIVDLNQFSDIGGILYSINGNGGRKKGEILIREKFPSGMYTGWQMKYDAFKKRPVPVHIDLGDSETKHELLGALLKQREHYLRFVRKKLRDTGKQDYRKPLEFFNAPS